MNKVVALFINCFICGFAVSAAGAPTTHQRGDDREQAAKEQRHFLECLSYVYSPALWISYNDSLYFAPTTQAQAERVASMKEARARYVALTDRQRRHDITAQAIAGSGIEAAWKQKILLPYSETNQNLTPTLERLVLHLPSYKVLQRLTGGDALIASEAGEVCFVMNFGRAADDAFATNGLFIREGEKTYTTQGGGQKTVEAFADAGLNAAERTVLERVSAAFRTQAASVRLTPIPAAEREEFDLIKARATESNPYFQFLVAKAYLDGKGTEKDVTLGMQWMTKAAANGSGDAKSYLAAHKDEAKPK